MRVERSDAQQVKSRLDNIKRKLEGKCCIKCWYSNRNSQLYFIIAYILLYLEQKTTIRPSAIEDHEAKVARQLVDEELRKKQRREAEQIKKQEQLQPEEEETVDPEIAAMLGFSGFGSSKR